jgi:hypothetical protein
VIDFTATTTTDGYPCHYFGTRLSACGATLHCVGVFTPFGLFERNYDSEGRRLSWDHGKARYYVDEQRQESVGPATEDPGLDIGQYLPGGSNYHNL